MVVRDQVLLILSDSVAAVVDVAKLSEHIGSIVGLPI